MNIQTVNSVPMAGRAVAQSLPDRRGSLVYDSPLRIFLVEDSMLLRDAVTEAITEPGHVEVIGYADSEKQAVEGVNRSMPDVVIVDIGLRDGNGLSLLRSISQMIWIRLPILIVLTNHASPEYAKASRVLGADYFFDKSTEFEDATVLIGALALRKKTASKKDQ